MESKERDVFIPSYFNKKENNQIETFLSPEIYSIRLGDAFIFGENSFIIHNEVVLYDLFESNEIQRFNLKFGSLLSIGKKTVAVLKSVIDVPIIEKGIFLSGFGSFNYFHFTIELMGKLKFIDSDQNYFEYPLIIDETVKQTSQLLELLNIMNTSNRDIIYIKKNHKYLVKDLIYISEISWMPINIKNNQNLINRDSLISKECLEYLRFQVLQKYQFNPTEKNLKIFISRKTLVNQRLINENAVSRIFKKYGFEIVFPEEMSLKDQVQLFSNADVVVGTTGAALTNIIYCRPGSTLISIVPQEYNFSIFSTIAHNLGIKSIYLDAEIIQRGSSIASSLFEVDLEVCENLLKNQIH